MPHLNNSPQSSDPIDVQLGRIGEALMILWTDNRRRITQELRDEIGNLLHTIEAVQEQPDIPDKGDFVRFPDHTEDARLHPWIYGWIRYDIPRGINPMAEIIALDHKMYICRTHEIQLTTVDEWINEED